MSQMLISETQARALLAARTLNTSARKATKRSIMRQIHADHPAIGGKKIVLFIENPDNPMYCIIRDKRTKLPLDDGKVAPKALPAPKTAAPAKKVAAKKVPAKKVAAAKPAVKVAAKKVPAKKAAPAAKKVIAKAPAKKVMAKKTAPVAKKAAPKAVAKKTAAKKR